MPCLTPYRGDSAQLLLFKIASCLEAGGGGSVTAAQIIAALGCTPACEGDVVNSFNTRVGDVVLTLADVSTVADGRYVLKAGDTMTGPLNMTAGQSYQYNGVNVIRAQTALFNYFFGPSGNLTMTGASNTSVGLGVLQANTSGALNTGVGEVALTSNTTGNNNTAIGVQALFSNTSGSLNVAIGQAALILNTTGASNTAFGYTSLLTNTSGNQNVAIGAASLFNNATGSFNTAVGESALIDVTTGSSNSALGRNSAGGITTGSNNTILGANVTGLAAGLSNNIIIADGAGNQRITVGSTGIVTIPIALTLATAAPLSITSGANQRAGDAVLVGGTVTVANTTVTANTRVYLTRKVAGGTIGFAVTYTVIAATSFTITSDNVMDTSTYSYLLIEVP